LADARTPVGRDHMVGMLWPEADAAHAPEGGPEHMMKVGDFGSNPNNSVHTIRSPDTAARARAIDFLISEKGQSLVVPVN
jgi:hypothetical protein